VKTQHEFNLKATILVDAEVIKAFKGVEVNRENVVRVLTQALESYMKDMRESVGSTGDWTSDAEAIATCMEYEVK
jgi:hypothetical protein